VLLRTRNSQTMASPLSALPMKASGVFISCLLNKLLKGGLKLVIVDHGFTLKCSSYENLRIVQDPNNSLHEKVVLFLRVSSFDIV